jgi:hypothetical protein
LVGKVPDPKSQPQADRTDEVVYNLRAYILSV